MYKRQELIFIGSPAAPAAPFDAGSGFKKLSPQEVKVATVASLSLDDKTIALAFPFLNENGIEFELDAVNPVSYTHLDVYKRQLLSNIDKY